MADPFAQLTGLPPPPPPPPPLSVAPPAGAAAAPAPPAAAPTSWQDFPVPPGAAALFAEADGDRDGLVGRQDAKAFFVRTGVPGPVLAKARARASARSPARARCGGGAPAAVRYARGEPRREPRPL